MIKQYNVENVNIQYQMVVVSPCVDRTVRIVFFSVYNNPNNSVHQLLSDLERLLAEIPSNLTAFIVGDFNVDILCKSNSSQKLMNMFKYYGFHQLCKPPSHRRGGGVLLTIATQMYIQRTLFCPQYQFITVITFYLQPYYLCV